MKQFLIKLLIDYIMDALELALQRMSSRSDNTVDDEIVEVIKDNREQIKDAVKAKI